MNAHSTIIHNTPKLQTPQMSINGKTDKQNVVSQYHDTLLTMEKNEVLIHATMGMNFESILLCERSQSPKIDTVLFHLSNGSIS